MDLNAASRGEYRGHVEDVRIARKDGAGLASQNKLIAQTDLVDRARPNEMEFSGERSESAATTG